MYQFNRSSKRLDLSSAEQAGVLCGLETFFTSRTQQTKVGMALSELINLLSGVIQGSSIGPVMFSMYIDGLAKLLEHHGIIAKLFADDVKIYLIIKMTSMYQNCKLPSI